MYELIALSSYFNISTNDLKSEEQLELNKHDGLCNNYYASRTARQRNEDNKQERLIKSKEYYYKNHEKLLHNKNERITCECGAHYTRSNRRQHWKTQKHINLLALIPPEEAQTV